MDNKTVQQIATEAKPLNYEELEELFLTIKEILYPDHPDHHKFVEDLREDKFTSGLTCPHCSATDVIRFGFFKGRQRYKCRACGETFSDYTRSPLRQSRYPEKWVLFAQCMLQGMCLRATAKEIEITLPTALFLAP